MNSTTNSGKVFVRERGSTIVHEETPRPGPLSMRGLTRQTWMVKNIWRYRKVAVAEAMSGGQG